MKTALFVHRRRRSPRRRLSSSRARSRPAPAPFDLEEATIADLQQRMQSGQDTSRSLVEKYLARIEAIDRAGPALHSVHRDQPRRAGDRRPARRRAQEPAASRGPLHGIPVLIKDNIATADRMMTTAGSLALAGVTPPKDAFIVARLREAGAVILGKTNLSEWANFRSTHSTSGWSGRGGQTRNPYALDRNPSGSSSGSGAADRREPRGGRRSAPRPTARSCRRRTTTASSGIKPTLGLVSRSGIVPIAHSQDTAGPMARTVADAAALLGAMAGADPDDPATKDAAARGRRDYTASLDPERPEGRAHRRRPQPAASATAPRPTALAEAAIADDEGSRARSIVDPANIPTLGKFDDSEFEVLLYEFKADLNKYLTWLGAGVAGALAEGRHRVQRRAQGSGDAVLRSGDHGDGREEGAADEREVHARRWRRNRRMARALGIDAVMTKYRLDALVAPTGGPAWLIDLVNGDSGTAARRGPRRWRRSPATRTSPCRRASTAACRSGMSFFGRAWSEPTLIKLAYAYEQATKHRKPPTFAPTADRP